MRPFKVGDKAIVILELSTVYGQKVVVQEVGMGYLIVNLIDGPYSPMAALPRELKLLVVSKLTLRRL